MRTKVAEKDTGKEAPPACHHYWVIEIANGPESRGVCQHCGEEKVFLNAIPSFSSAKREARPHRLPEIPDVELDKDSQS